MTSHAESKVFQKQLNLRLSCSIVGAGEAEAVARVIEQDGYLGMGQEVSAFEQDLAEFLGVPAERVVTVNSGTAALQLAVEAIVEPGAEVLVQSLTFVASFQAISAAGAVPMACDVLLETATIDLEDAARKLSPRTKAIMPVHYGSNPGALDEIYDFARKHGLRVIEDAAHAFGCTYQNRLIGSFGDVACFSFDGIKNITSGEGGALVTGDQICAERARNARLLGVEKDTEKRRAGQRSWDFDVTRQGYRFHMSNINAAIGRVQLKRFSTEFGPQRIALAKQYRERLALIPGVRLFEADIGAIVPHIQPVCIANNARDGVRQRLADLGIETGIHYKPNHLLSLYRDDQAGLPNTMALHRELLSLPLHPGLSIEDVDYVCDVLQASIPPE